MTRDLPHAYTKAKGPDIVGSPPNFPTSHVVPSALRFCALKYKQRDWCIVGEKLEKPLHVVPRLRLPRLGYTNSIAPPQPSRERHNVLIHPYASVAYHYWTQQHLPLHQLDFLMPIPLAVVWTAIAMHGSGNYEWDHDINGSL